MPDTGRDDDALGAAARRHRTFGPAQTFREYSVTVWRVFPRRAVTVTR